MKIYEIETRNRANYYCVTNGPTSFELEDRLQAVLLCAMLNCANDLIGNMQEEESDLSLKSKKNSWDICNG